MKLPRKTLERKLFKNGYQVVYAVDEVGMGSLAGPVVACVVAITKSFYDKPHEELRGVNDSKLLSVRQRKNFSERLTRNKEIVFSVSYCHPKTIDQSNIFNASRLAMRRAIKKVQTKFVRSKGIVLVDGPHKIEEIKIDQMPIIKGDRRIFSIACASIIAKVYRDRIMTRYAKKFPGYGFDKHMGYGTKYHREKLASLGVLEIHRKSFTPVAKLL